MKTYKKIHESKEAMNDHISKIKKRGGSYRIKGNILEYGFIEKSKDTSIKSKTTPDLIMEAAKKGYKKVKVVFIPAYEESLHNNVKNKELLKSLKTSKTETFDVVEETSEILKLLKSKDVKDIHFV